MEVIFTDMEVEIVNVAAPIMDLGMLCLYRKVHTVCMRYGL